MIENLLMDLENLVGTDDFEYDSEDIMAQIEETGAGIETIENLLAIMERHPLDDFGMPGAMVHFMERFYPDFLPFLFRSVRRAPALHTVWMLNRCMNGSSDKEPYRSALHDVVNNENADQAVRDSAREFLANQ